VQISLGNRDPGNPYPRGQFRANYSSLFPFGDPVIFCIIGKKPETILTLRLMEWIMREEPATVQILNNKNRISPVVQLSFLFISRLQWSESDEIYHYYYCHYYTRL